LAGCLAVLHDPLDPNPRFGVSGSDNPSRSRRAERHSVPENGQLREELVDKVNVRFQEGQSEVFLGRETIVASYAMEQILQLVRRVAQTKASVLVRGDTGTGKEHIARAIHHYSLRHAKPWVDVNCGALPEHLMESELFGHERGAFSGADSAKPGLFELAHTGTIFLDEVAELSPVMQVKLLRVLDGTPYYRLGGVKKVSVDVRVVAATNRDLEEATGQGKFRRDLYYRLNEFSIQVPPLRERPEDILPLAEFFLRQVTGTARLSDEAKELLRNWTWAGNIRELRNVVVSAAILSEHCEITAACLPANMRGTETIAGLEGWNAVPSWRH
jgi:transcriptional regulator with GAF, ATPase, and Fis domain